MLRVVFKVLLRLHRGYEVLKPRIFPLYGARCTRAPYGVAPEPQFDLINQAEGQLSLLSPLNFHLKLEVF